METSGIVCKTVSRLPATTRVVDHGRQLNSIRVSVRPSRKIQSCRRLSCQFSDFGHVQYYVSPRSGAGGVATKKDKEKNSEIKRVKKKLKLIKRLSKDLSLLPQITNGDDIRIGLAAEAPASMIHEASDSLMAQLQKLKTEQKELKRKLKEEKAQLKATMEKSSSSSSSSSSSESSDSDCGKVVDMKTLRNNALKQSLKIEAPTDDALEQSLEIEAPTDDALEQSSSLEVTVAAETTLANSLLELENSDSSPQIRVRVPHTEFNAESSSSTKKIEVCMGGKCKKLGGGALLEEFEKKVGAEGSVVACKCMGKCKTAPNVRVLNNSESGTGAIINEDSVRLGFNSTCTGVGLQDVDLIVANLLGKEVDDECMMLSS